MTVISTIAGVQSRVAVLRNRFAGAETPSGDDSSASGSNAAYGRGAGFDPFGAAYQQAMGTVSASKAFTNTATVGATNDAATLTAVNTMTAQRVRHSAPATAASNGAMGAQASAAVTAPASNSGRSGSALSGEQIAQLAYNAGFRGNDLVSVVAISKRESGWRPDAFNGNRGTRDVSYGLMQINMIDELGPARLAQFGLTSADQLLDPQTNMNAAFTLYTRSGNTLRAWGGYKGLSNTFGTDMAGAQAAVNNAGLATA